MLVLFLLASFSFKINAQNNLLSLQNAIEIGLKNNMRLQAEDINIQLQNQLKNTAKEMPKTNISAMLGQYNTRKFDQNFGISQSFNPFLWKVKKELLTANVQTAALKQQIAKQEVTFQIRQSWNTILYYQTLNNNILKEDSLIRGFVKAAALRFKTGETGQLENVTAIAKQQELQQQIQQNQFFIQIEKAKLLHCLNQKEDFSIAQQAFLPFENTFLKDTIQLEKNPNLELALQSVKTAEAEKMMQIAEQKPEFTGGYFIQSLTGKQEVDNQIVYYNGVPRFQGVTLGVSLPIFGKAANKAKIQAAETNILLQQKNVAIQQSELQSLFAQELQQLNISKSQLAYHQNTALQNAQLIVKNASKAYQNGDISYIEYLQGIQTARDIQRNYLDAILKHNQSVINLQFLLNN